MISPHVLKFDPATFLANAGLGRKIVQFKPSANFFVQGSPADFVLYLQSGRAKLTVVSKTGKEATITLLSAGDFIGEESIAGPLGLRMATATAITTCTALKIERDEMIRVMHEEHTFSDLFLKFLLARSMRMPQETDLITTSSSTPVSAPRSNPPPHGRVRQARRTRAVLDSQRSRREHSPR